MEHALDVTGQLDKKEPVAADPFKDKEGKAIAPLQFDFSKANEGGNMNKTIVLNQKPAPSKISFQEKNK